MIYRNLDTKELMTKAAFNVKGYWGITPETDGLVSQTINPSKGAKTLSSLLNKALPAAIDASFQIHQDAQNPALSNGVRARRILVTVSVGLVGGRIAGFITKAVFGASPSAWAILGVSLAVGLIENEMAGGVNDWFPSGPKKEFVPLR